MLHMMHFVHYTHTSLYYEISISSIWVSLCSGTRIHSISFQVQFWLFYVPSICTLYLETMGLNGGMTLHNNYGQNYKHPAYSSSFGQSP